ncbi:hypothetical protein D1970_17910 [Mesobacillus zeae]|uniref:Uncharacterized protein n=1 Tax=Mesobacillus zeae TaxID=1917180 RepID=A0A398B1J6_9BACI|nr:hypothetical protein [Mesobacillus zeae]RID82778.1 hypothetical protein D1970_17910 [Mesobacillus zeae]
MAETKHLPEIIIADRGEFEGYSVENLINNLNIKIENTTAYRGDLKGFVDYRLDATLNLCHLQKQENIR